METDYRDFIDIAKLNLSKKLDETINLYEQNKSSELKSEIIELIKDKREIMLYNTEVIKKYI